MMADWNLRTTWESAYRIRGGRPNKQDSILATGEGYGQILSYLDGRVFAVQASDDGLPGLSVFRRNLQQLGAVPAFTPATDVLVVGCGFGWILEVMMDAGSNSAWGADISSIIHAEMANANVPAEVSARVLNVDITDPTAKAQFIAAGAGTNKGEFRWVVTEQLIDVMETAEIASFLDACDDLRTPGQGGVAHLVAAQDAIPPGSSDPDLILQQLTLAEFVALRPSHWWVDAVTGDIGGGQ
jgi:SAM-dependent methyltransferase